jgi:hypothetical protein
MMRLIYCLLIIFFSSATWAETKSVLRAPAKLSTTARVTMGLGYSAALYAASQSGNGASTLNTFHVVTLLLPGAFLRYTEENPVLGSYLMTSGLEVIAVNGLSKSVNKLELNTLLAINAAMAYAVYYYMPSGTWHHYSLSLVPEVDPHSLAVSEKLVVNFSF